MEESLFAGVRFDRLREGLDDDDDDDDVYGSRGSEFETESLGSSSTTDDDGEEMAAMLGPSHKVRRRRPPSTSEDSSTDVDAEETPTWFYHGPFKYNGRMAVLALPGLALALQFSGELLVIVSDIAIFVLKRDVKLQLTNQPAVSDLARHCVIVPFIGLMLLLLQAVSG